MAHEPSHGDLGWIALLVTVEFLVDPAGDQAVWVGVGGSLYGLVERRPVAQACCLGHGERAEEFRD